MNAFRAARGRSPQLLIGAIIASVAIVAALILFVGQPWTEQPVPETTPRAEAAGVTLLEVKKTAQLRAATGTYSVPVHLDAQQHDAVRRRIPDVLDGDKTVAIYQGSVDALIDLGRLTEEDLSANPQARTLTIKVPEPTLTRPNIDLDKSRIITRSRGVFVRVSDAFKDTSPEHRRLLDQAAVDAITEAAAHSSLKLDAEHSGRQFLTAVGHRFGYDTVTITYVKPTG